MNTKTPVDTTESVLMKRGRTLATYRNLFLLFKTTIEQNKQSYDLSSLILPNEGKSEWQAACRRTCDLQIRRWAEYGVKQDVYCANANSYMYRVGDPSKPTELEHVIPNSKTIPQYMANKASVFDLLFAPMCKVAKPEGKMLKGSFVTGGEDFEKPFMRYSEAGITTPIYTWSGLLIDPKTWTLAQHREHVIWTHPIWGVLVNEFST